MFDIMKNYYKCLFLLLLLYVLTQMINVTFYLVSSSFPSACNKSLSETSPCCNGFGTSPWGNCFGGVDVAFAKLAKRDLLALLILQGDFVREFWGLEVWLVD